MFKKFFKAIPKAITGIGTALCNFSKKVIGPSMMFATVGAFTGIGFVNLSFIGQFLIKIGGLFHVQKVLQIYQHTIQE